jgi:hypothetical protein
MGFDSKQAQSEREITRRIPTKKCCLPHRLVKQNKPKAAIQHEIVKPILRLFFGEQPSP